VKVGDAVPVKDFDFNQAAVDAQSNTMAAFAVKAGGVLAGINFGGDLEK
jgi:hypothetical protein